jgi:hypothetical protein
VTCIGSDGSVRDGKQNEGFFLVCGIEYYDLSCWLLIINEDYIGVQILHPTKYFQIKSHLV